MCTKQHDTVSVTVAAEDHLDDMLSLKLIPIPPSNGFWLSECSGFLLPHLHTIFGVFSPLHDSCAF